LAGQEESDTYTADGVTGVVQTNYAALLDQPNSYPLDNRRTNRLLRPSHTTINGVPADLFKTWDWRGRLLAERNSVAELVHSYSYDAAGWLSVKYDGPGNAAVRFDRDSSGRVLRAADVYSYNVNSPIGRERRFTWRPD